MLRRLSVNLAKQRNSAAICKTLSNRRAWVSSNNWLTNARPRKRLSSGVKLI